MDQSKSQAPGIDINELLAMVGEATVKERIMQRHIDTLENSFTELMQKYNELMACLAMADFIKWLYNQMLSSSSQSTKRTC